MFKNIFSSKVKNEDAVVSAIVLQTAALITELQKTIDLRFLELSGQVKEIELGLQQLETKLLTKDLKDKQAYGLLHYKLHEAKNSKLVEEIKELEDALESKKIPIEDH
jgi:hypothetical protein